ncbi:MAG: hypothetical protein QM689_03765 [Oscillospiraceae bacterium]
MLFFRTRFPMLAAAAKNVLIFAACAAAVWYCFRLIAFSNEVQTAVRLSVTRCAAVIIPSLFAFMAVSELIVRTGLYAYLALPLYPFYRYVLGMDRAVFFAFVVGNVSGYPVGIRTLANFVSAQTLTREQAEKAACFCYAGGPAFAAGAVGGAVFGDPRIGTLLFLSSLCANTATAFLFGLRGRKQRFSGTSGQRPQFQCAAQDVIASAENAGRALFMICVLIVLFAAVLAVAESTGIFTLAATHFGWSSNVLRCVRAFFEISFVSGLTGAPYGLLPLISCTLAFGGLCVMLQIVAVNRKLFSLRLFFLTRPLNIALNLLFLRIFWARFVPDALAANAAPPVVLVNHTSTAPSVCLIFMIILLLLKKRLVFQKNM